MKTKIRFQDREQFICFHTLFAELLVRSSLKITWRDYYNAHELNMILIRKRLERSFDLEKKICIVLSPNHSEVLQKLYHMNLDFLVDGLQFHFLSGAIEILKTQEEKYENLYIKSKLLP